jgi:PAS domain S-box-containing protein
MARTWWLWTPDQVLVTLDADARVTLWNRGAERLFGPRGEEVVGKPLVDVLPKAVSELLMEAVRAAQQTGTPAELRDVTVRIREEHGTRHLDVRCSPFAPSGGRDRHFLLVATDVTERHREDVLARALDLGKEALPRSTPLPPATAAVPEEDARRGPRGPLGFLADSVMVVDRDDRVVMWPGSTAALFGVPTPQAIGQDVYELLPFLDVPSVREAAQRSLRGVSTTVESLPLWGGSWLRLMVSPAGQGANRQGYVIVASVERGEPPGGVAQSLQQHFAAVADNASDPMLLLTPDGSAIAANDAAKRFFNLRNPVRHVALRALLATPLKGPLDTARPETRTVRVRGAKAKACTMITWPVEASGAKGVEALFLDTSGRDRREERLLRDRDLLLVYNRILTHDVGNLLMAMMNYLQLAETPDVPEKARGRIASARGIATEIQGLLDNVRILSAAPGRAPRIEPLDGHEALSQALAMAAVAFPRKEVRPAPVVEPAMVRAESTLAQVFYNLASNALRHNPKPDAYVEARAAPSKLGGQPAMTWTILDNGPGIPVDMRAPRPLEQCTSRHGLGLAIAHALVRRWGGQMVIEDRVPGQEGSGAAVHVTLPLAKAAGPRTSPPAEALPRATPTRVAARPRPARRASSGRKARRGGKG